MKNYLNFNKCGTVDELKTNQVIFKKSDYNFEHLEEKKYKQEIFIILYNSTNEDNSANHSKIPFIDNKIYSNILLFKVNNFEEYKLKNISEEYYIKLINKEEYIDYSSDDFNPDTCNELKKC